jgi:DNA-directed RNA polymerase subunit RPC12/RpoP
MHVTDAGVPHGGDGAAIMAKFECSRCGATSGWVQCATHSEARRGIPCAYCNALTQDRRI